MTHAFRSPRHKASPTGTKGYIALRNILYTRTQASGTILNDDYLADAGDPYTIHEGDGLSGMGADTFTGMATWSDGATSPVSISGGTFSTTRTFLDDHPASGTASDPLTVATTITDDDLGSNTAREL